jgi:hypothetical protein
MIAISLLALLLGGPAPTGLPQVNPAVDVLTNRYDVERTGANLRETVLNVKNITAGSFGKLFEREVDGDIYAQPLIKTAVPIPGQGIRNVVYVATVSNSLYAFDADSPSADKPLWRVSREVFGNPVPKGEVTDLPPDTEYLNFGSVIGIVATPVIDDTSGTIYVVAYSRSASKSGAGYRFRLHAFDIATGREKSEMHSPMTIEASYLGNGVGSVDGKIRFEARKMLNRAALLLVDGVIYLAFTSYLDGEPKFDYHGWVMAYDAKTLRQISALCTTPDGIQGGIWQSGAGLSAERREGTFPLIYAAVSNGSVGGRNYGESVLQLYPGALLSVKLAYTPPNHAYLNDRDLDLSTAPLLLPDLPLLVACAKDGKCHVIDRSTLQRVQEFPAGSNSYGGERASNIHGTPVVWRDPNHKLRLYVWGEEDYLRAFQFDGQRFVGAGKSKFAAPMMSMPGGVLTISANGSQAGSAILWASIPEKHDANVATVPGMLRAFDAADVEQELWNSSQNPRDKLGMLAKFCPPVVANGKVYVATFAEAGGKVPNKLVVYGLLPAAPQLKPETSN